MEGTLGMKALRVLHESLVEDEEIDALLFTIYLGSTQGIIANSSPGRVLKYTAASYPWTQMEFESITNS
jgi:hypothetical protein